MENNFSPGRYVAYRELRPASNSVFLNSKKFLRASLPPKFWRNKSFGVFAIISRLRSLCRTSAISKFIDSI